MAITPLCFSSVADLRNADFFGDVFVTFQGWNGIASDVQLLDDSGNRVKLTRGSTNTFNVMAPDVGSYIYRVRGATEAEVKGG